ncbi:Steroid 5-alpha reductase family enzyme [Luteibacter sp. UNCMF331Sha3.1]|uniref:DUF1295 domain-containing protein n=1 Tax=Luteibacter sp. UNCMF331Sha3.1 TaxID=1502760 RepID=UPI0008B2890C|nr:DUF1295 domain-containing protein [Luteibacter sp. UNCMF331Sha3.1]SEN17771.1 Steroid 5-alpha reductase family enzyme [Luteibacter sp. UNCMF331Sha3.1]
MSTALAFVFAVMAIAMALGWWWQRAKANANIVDAIWAAGVGFAAATMAWVADGDTWARALTATLGVLWAVRLATHLAGRVGEKEDGRYRYLREHWQGNQAKFFAFFMGQAVVVLLFALPFYGAASNPATTPATRCLAIAIWLVSVGGEAIADRQLRRHRASGGTSTHTTFRGGLWRFSRHPNYFFEWVHWFAYVVLAGGAANAWLAWTGPVLMYLFLRYLSGVPFTEAQALRSRGDDYRRYQRTTNMFFPWFPKHTDEVAHEHD